MESNIELACQCGALMIIRKSSQLSIDNKRIEKWSLDHEPCRQAYIAKINAEARRALMLRIAPGEILETIDAPNYTKALEDIASTLHDIFLVIENRLCN